MAISQDSFTISIKYTMDYFANTNAIPTLKTTSKR